MDQLDEKIDFLNELLDDDGWQTTSNDNNVYTQKMFLHGSDIASFRSFGFVNADAASVMNYVWNAYSDPNQIKMYDPDVVHYEIIKFINKNTRLCYQINKLPWPIWKRDLVYLQTRIIDNDASCIIMYSVDSSANPEEPNKYVRVFVNISAYVFKPVKDGCIVYRIVHVDPMGDIPPLIVNKYAGKTARIIKDLQAIYQ